MNPIKSLLALSFVILSACGPQEVEIADGSTPGIWRFDCLRVRIPREIFDGKTLFSMDRAFKSALKAKELIDRRYGAGTFCSLAEDIEVEIVADYFYCGIASPHGMCQGQYLSIEKKIISYQGHSLVHEFIHVQETRQFKLGTMWHENWYTGGQYALTHEEDASWLPWLIFRPIKP